MKETNRARTSAIALAAVIGLGALATNYWGARAGAQTEEKPVIEHINPTTMGFTQVEDNRSRVPGRHTRGIRQACVGPDRVDPRFSMNQHLDSRQHPARAGLGR